MSGDFCYVGEQYCVAKMLVSELCAAHCPLVVEPGLEACRPTPAGLTGCCPSRGRRKQGSHLSTPAVGCPRMVRGMGLCPDAGSGCTQWAAVLGQVRGVLCLPWGSILGGVTWCLRGPLFPAAEISVPEKVCRVQDCGTHPLH